MVCFVAGWIVANLPSPDREKLWRTFKRMERPILLVFLALAGAVWDVTDFRGWLLVPVFVVARVVGKAIALATLQLQKDTADLPLDRESRLLFAPLSVLSIALVMAMQSMYRGESLSWIVTAVIGSAIVCEFLVQLSSRAGPRSQRAPAP